MLNVHLPKYINPVRHAPTDVRNMNRIEKLRKWENTIKDGEVAKGNLIKLLGADLESTVLSSITKLQEAFTESVAREVSDTEEWLLWYWRDNHMGLLSGRVGLPGGGAKRVESLEDLEWVIWLYDSSIL